MRLFAEGHVDGILTIHGVFHGDDSMEGWPLRWLKTKQPRGASY